MEHIISLGIDPKIPPISIMDADFGDHVEKHRSDKARASEMEHALRFHIRKHLDEDPEHYRTLSEQLDTILSELQDRWDDLVEALKEFVSEVQAGRQEDDTGLDPETQAPFLGIIKQAVAGNDDLAEEDLRRLCELTVELVEHIQQELRIVGFWNRAQAQNQLRSWVVQTLDDRDILPFDRLPHVAERIVELAKVNHGKLVR